MLKIKDNVDLKELENFGLYKTLSTPNGEYMGYANIGCDVLIKPNRIISFDSNKLCVGLRDEILYDLIKADLVEKDRSW